MDEEDYTLGFLLRRMFESTHTFMLWFIPLVLAVMLRVGTSIDWIKLFRVKGHKGESGLGELVFPICTYMLELSRYRLTLRLLDFVLIPLVFYIVVFAAHLDIATLRHNGWVFDLGTSSSAAAKDQNWWSFYSYLNFKVVRWEALWATMPTQLAL